LALIIDNMGTDDILNAFGLNPADYKIENFGSGLINHTFKVSGKAHVYILQQINTAIFKSPNAIAENLRLIESFLKSHHPDYLFSAPLPARSGEYLVKTPADEFYRLLPFVKGSHTVNFVSDEKQAFEAAKQFGKFSRLLNDFDAALLKYTLPDFHNLELRFSQFKAALKIASEERLKQAENEINEVYRHIQIIETYRQLIHNRQIPLRVIHHDTKINNVLFDADSNGLCVIDLDTVMPGYFLSDAGDMMRTYLSPANEEEQDLSKIQINNEYFSAIYKGYMREMGDVLTEAERNHFIFSGEFMIYMQALRFLTDFLNNDSYYGSAYPGHNLNRAKNQFTLLNKYLAARKSFRIITGAS
jgi:Ser/Thr protein kinase RdoA (MazF antagonist)